MLKILEGPEDRTSLSSKQDHRSSSFYLLLKGLSGYGRIYGKSLTHESESTMDGILTSLADTYAKGIL